MFGFLTAPCSGCSSREHSAYRAHFCGLCSRLRQDYGLPMRFLVNRDATFLSLLGNALTDSPALPVSTTCCNPLGKPRQVVQDGGAVSYAAAVTLCGLRAKLDDEVTDRRFRATGFALRGVRGALARPVARAQDVLRRQGVPVEAVRNALEDQASLEQEASGSGKPDLETLSRPTAFSFGQILAHTSEHARVSLEQIGQSLGRLMYTLDAVVDRERDRRTRQFNPFLLQPRLIDAVPDLLNRDLGLISTGMRDLPLSAHREVLDLVLVRNLRQTCTAMLASGGKQKKKRNRDNASTCGCDGWDLCYCCDCTGCDGGECCDCGGCDCDVCCCDCS